MSSEEKKQAAEKIVIGSITPSSSQTVEYLPLLVSAYSAMGNQEEARKWLAKMMTLPEGTPYRSVYIAVAHAWRGDIDEFFNWAKRASEEKGWGFGRLRLIEREIPLMRHIHEDPRFKELFKKVGLEA